MKMINQLHVVKLKINLTKINNKIARRLITLIIQAFMKYQVKNNNYNKELQLIDKIIAKMDKKI